MASSPTQRTLALMRTMGMTCQVVERWNAFAMRRVDLFGVIDIVAVIIPDIQSDIYPAGIYGIQTTSGSGHSARIAKSIAEPRIKKWLLAGGRFEVWSWRKAGARGKAKRWKVRKTPLTLKNGEIIAGEEIIVK